MLQNKEDILEGQLKDEANYLKTILNVSTLV